MKPVKQQDQSNLKWVTDFIWNIADDRLRDDYVRGKYRDRYGLRLNVSLRCNANEATPQHRQPFYQTQTAHRPGMGKTNIRV